MLESLPKMSHSFYQSEGMMILSKIIVIQLRAKQTAIIFITVFYVFYCTLDNQNNMYRVTQQVLHEFFAFRDILKIFCWIHVQNLQILLGHLVAKITLARFEKWDYLGHFQTPWSNNIRCKIRFALILWGEATSNLDRIRVVK